VRDLFNKNHKEGEYEHAKVRLHPQKGVYVEGLSRKTASTAAQVKFFIERGSKERATAETKMNAHSSRSHAIFQIQMTQKNVLDGTVRTSTINLVDLAGSERVKHSGVTGDALKETQNINQSLSTLRKVIDTLIDNSKLKPHSKQRHIPPFRESLLTWVLSDSLGGNSKTMMMAAISPHIVNVEETISTLRYALRAKAIVCSAKVNEEKSAALMSGMKDEIKKLQAQLASGERDRKEEEIRREIEEHQAEMANLEEAFTKKEEEMNKQINMQLEKSEHLKVEINQQKSMQFSNAFRNAFLIKKNCEELASAKALLELKTNEAEDMLDRTLRRENEVAASTKMYEDEISSLKQEISTLQKVLCEKDGIIHENNHKLLELEQAVQVTTKKVVAQLALQKELEDKIKILDYNLDAAHSQIALVETENEMLSEREARAMEKNAALCVMTQRLEHTLAAKENVEKELVALISSLKDQSQGENAKNAELHEQVRALKQELQSCCDEKAASNETLVGIKQKLAETYKSLQEVCLISGKAFG